MKKNVSFLFFLIAFNGLIFSQSTNDAGFWATFNLEKKFKKNISIFLTEEYRMRENLTRTNLFYTDLGVQINPLSFLKVSLAYRSIQKNLIDNTFSFRHRLMLDITLKQKFGNIALSYRQRLQSEVRNVYSSESGAVPEWYSRNKIELKYDLGKRITPYVAAEFRFQLHNPRSLESDNSWHRNRYIAGLDYEKNKRNSFGLYYLIQQEYNVSAPQNLYIVGLEYTLSL